MKKMQILGAIMLALVLMIVSGCQKQEYIDPSDLTPINDGVLKIFVSGGPLGGSIKSTDAVGDTVKIEGGNVYTFTYTSTIPLTTVQWTFYNNGTTSSEKMPSNRYDRNFIVSQVRLVGVDQGGTAHQKDIWLNNLPRANGDPVILVSSTLIATGIYRQTFAMYKNGAYVAPLDYKYKGNTTSPPWQNLVVISPADTNYRFEGGQFYSLPSGENGHWTKVIIDAPINFDVELAPLIRVTQNYGEQWASFKGSAYVQASNSGLMRYHVGADGTITPIGGVSNQPMPGLGEDNYIRFDLASNGDLIIYQNNEVSFSSNTPWIQFKSNDSWATPLVATAEVSGFPNWSKSQIGFVEMPKRARFGSNINQGIPNTNNTNSIYYDNIYKDIFINVTKIPVSKPGGGDGGFVLSIKKTEQ